MQQDFFFFFKGISAIWWRYRVTLSCIFMSRCGQFFDSYIRKNRKSILTAGINHGNKAFLFVRYLVAKSCPPAPPLGQGMFRFVSPSLEVHKHILLQPCFVVFLLYLHPCRQIAPTLPCPVANNIPLFCTQLSQTLLTINLPSIHTDLFSNYV